MKRTAWLLIALLSAAGNAATINMNDPRRAVGTDEGIRVDAELLSDSVSPGSPIRIAYQIQNSSSSAVAIAERNCDASYDSDSRTLTLSIGSEVPAAGQMPRLTIVHPGEKRVFGTAGTFSGRATPRYVQIRVNVLRDVAAFLPVVERQPLNDAQFNRWIEANVSIELNLLPVRYEPAVRTRSTDASQR